MFFYSVELTVISHDKYDFRGLGGVGVGFFAKSPHQATWAGDDFNNESTWSFWCRKAEKFCVRPYSHFICIVRMGLNAQYRGV